MKSDLEMYSPASTFINNGKFDEIRNLVFDAVYSAKTYNHKVKVALGVVYSVIKDAEDDENILLTVMGAISGAIDASIGMPELETFRKFITSIAVNAIPDGKTIRLF